MYGHWTHRRRWVPPLSPECDGRSYRTYVLDVSSSVSDRVFVAASFVCTGRCCTGGLMFASGRRRPCPGSEPSRRHLSDVVGQSGVATPLPWPGATCGRRRRYWVVVGVQVLVSDASERLDKPVPVHVAKLFCVNCLPSHCYLIAKSFARFVRKRETLSFCSWYIDFTRLTSITDELI